jgi:hypothetical protein
MFGLNRSGAFGLDAVDDPAMRFQGLRQNYCELQIMCRFGAKIAVPPFFYPKGLKT